MAGLAGVREQRGLVWAGAGVIALGIYGFVATLQPEAEFGRILAAYGGVFVAGSLAWGIVFDGFRPDRWDLIGAGVRLLGVLDHHVRAPRMNTPIPAILHLFRLLSAGGDPEFTLHLLRRPPMRSTSPGPASAPPVAAPAISTRCRWPSWSSRSTRASSSSGGRSSPGSGSSPCPAASSTSANRGSRPPPASCSRRPASWFAAADVTLVDVLSAPDGTVLIFGRAPAVSSTDLPVFAPTPETSEWLIVKEPQELAFPCTRRSWPPTSPRRRRVRRRRRRP